MAERILLAHGDGGILTHTLIQELFHKYFTSAELATLSDAAILPFPAPTNLLAMTTDSFVVNPLIFPGGDIGKLAIAGTVNDLAVSGATPLYLSAAFILEEGLDLSQLEKIVASMAATARAAHVKIITGDTKVVEHGRCDGMYINTTGIGMMQPGIHLGYDKIQPGDQLLINGGVGEHGVAVLAERAGLSFSTPLYSDCAALNGLIQDLLARFGASVKFMRDPTRGGLATTAKEIALSAKFDIWLKDEQIPVKDEVRGACELLGLDPLYLANEGKVMLVVDAQKAEEILSFIRDYYEVNGLVAGLNSAVIGEIRSGQGRVLLETPLGGTRLLEMLAGAPLPRIC